jgi:hypothetical protein
MIIEQFGVHLVPSRAITAERIRSSTSLPSVIRAEQSDPSGSADEAIADEGIAGHGTIVSTGAKALAVLRYAAHRQQASVRAVSDQRNPLAFSYASSVKTT